MLDKPLADLLRPNSLNDIVGQEHLLGKHSLLIKSVLTGNLPSIIFWGPPGSGKTSLAKLLVKEVGAKLISISAVLSGVKEIRSAIEKSKSIKNSRGKVVVFVDEVHRFNKAQQDAFLPHIESGLFVFIGATTENPGFEINPALRSRTQTLILNTLSEDAQMTLFDRGLKALKLTVDSFSRSAKQYLVKSADGDGRRLLNYLENLSANLENSNKKNVDLDEIKKIFPHIQGSFDKKGDYFYDQISAFHKSVRGSDPDASLYWMNRMLDGGIDPKYLARRMIRIACEDIGLADPRALSICTDAATAYDRLGSPEGELALAQATIFLAVAAKSNSVYKAFNLAKKLVKTSQSFPVPFHLRNAPTNFAKEIGCGLNYDHSHNHPDGVSKDQSYFPDSLSKTTPIFYEPVNRGLESKIAEKLIAIRSKKNGF